MLISSRSAAAALNKAFQTTLDEIQSKFPFWSRTEGRDHIFVFPTERGPAILTDANLQRIRKVRKNDECAMRPPTRCTVCVCVVSMRMTHAVCTCARVCGAWGIGGVCGG
jgi:hypothetical protein